MKTKTFIATSSIVLAASAVVYGQAPAPAPASPPSAGLLNDYFRGQNPDSKSWDVGGQFRARLEHKEYFAAPGQAGAIDFRAKGGDPDNTYVMLREKLHVGYSPTSWLTFFAEARDSSTHNDDRNPNVESDTFDLHQGYIQLGNGKDCPFSLKLGRQEMIYGDERLIGASDFNNLGRVFDAAKLRYEDKDLWVDLFTSRVVVPDDNNFNVSNEYDTFSGIYASTKTLIPKQETQVYFLARNTERGSLTLQTGGLVGLPSPRDIYTIGGRVKSLPGKFNGWDYEGEGAYQFGRFKATAASKSLDQEAFAVHVAGGYTWAKSSVQPRVGLEYNFASGDSSSTDSKHETFENLFPTNHKFYGFMDFISWQNIHNLRATASIKPYKGLSVTADYHLFWLADTHDSFYNVVGAPRTGGGTGTGTGYAINSKYGSFVGSEFDLIATYAIKPYAVLQAGYGHFFVGQYVKQSLAKPAFGAKDADWLYSQVTFNF